MRFSEQRETIYKGLARIIDEQRAAGKLTDLPVPVATPRYIADPPALAFKPAQTRADRRARMRDIRRLSGAGFKMPAFEKPWRSE